MTDEEAAALRKQFDPGQIGKLPKISCRNCTDARGKVCDEHRKQKCQVCGNYLTTAHVDLDFVGHADVTDRLLSVDPEWTWEPCATTAEGLPMLDKSGGLWIRLTVCGVTRLGYGDGPDPKQLIGDSLRNAAMRFGVALDLWAKGKLESEVDAQHAERPATAADAAREKALDEEAREAGYDSERERAARHKALRDKAAALSGEAKEQWKAWIGAQGRPPFPFPVLEAAEIQLAELEAK